MHAEARPATKRRYAYQSYRQGDRVIKRYIGIASDPDVQLSLEYGEIQTSHSYRIKRERKAERNSSLDCETCLITLDMMTDKWQVLQMLLDGGDRGVTTILGQRLTTDMEDFDDMTDQAEALPTRSDFSDLCRRVGTGDEVANLHLRRLIREAPKLFANLVDLIEISKEQTIRLVAGDSASTKVLLELQFDKEIDAIFPPTEDASVIRRMQAEVMYLQRLDFLRCHVALSRAPENQSDFKFWASMTKRAQSRYQRSVRDWTRSNS